MTHSGEIVAHVEALYRYPVKSMRGEALDEAELFWLGIVGDRRWAFVKTGSTAGFPWLTARELPPMIHYVAAFEDPSNTYQSPVMITTPSGDQVAVDSDELRAELSDLYGAPAHLMRLNRGCHDAMPVSLMGVGSVRAMGIASGVGADMSHRRFRPNIVADIDEPFAEDGWIGSLIQIGEGEDAARIRLNRQNIRCAVPNIDPETGERDPNVLKTITEQRDMALGVYGSCERPGIIRRGDPIILL